MNTPSLLARILRLASRPKARLLLSKEITFNKQYNFSMLSSSVLLKTTYNNNFQVQDFFCQVRKYANAKHSPGVNIVCRNGLPIVTVPLPSRQEMCSFTLKPVSSTVADFLENLKNEDKGIDRACIYTTDGARVAGNTQIEHLLQDKFLLSINDNSYHVDPPVLEQVSSESMVTLDQAKILISHLYSQLHIDEHQLVREQQLISRLENLKLELGPLEKAKDNLASSASTRTNLLMWGGLAAMATQFGILARLTWWEYSWDIMEPVTYFITYGTAIIMYGYFVLTQQEYVYPDARDRQYLRYFHRGADKSKFDVKRYNNLCDQIAHAEQDLQRLRDPLQLHLPAEPIRIKGMKELNLP